MPALHQRNLKGDHAMPIKYKPAPCSHEEIRRLFDYNSDSGKFTRKAGSYCRAPRDVGYVHHSGYAFVTMPGTQKRIAAHRLAWFWYSGKWPPEDIDHINGVRSDNRIANLRLATRSDNCRNMKARRNKRGALIGCSFHAASGKWAARIRYGGKDRWLGVYPTEEEAHKAYLKAKADLHQFQPVPRELA